MKVAVVQLLDKPCVRTRKVISAFLKLGHDITYVGVPRGTDSIVSTDFETVLLGIKIPRGSFKKLYLQFVFFKKAAAYLKSSDFDLVYAVDFDGGVPVFFSKYKNKFIYDVLDTYADRYKIPSLFKWLLRKFESSVAGSAKIVIHVDELREPTLSVPREKVLIVENVPNINDLLPLRESVKQRNCFLISGGVFHHRGLLQILEAHKLYCDLNAAVPLKIIGGVGKGEGDLISRYSNVEVIGPVSSKDAQFFAADAYAVFAMYEPTSEININACPNKVYDCLFNATPAIINSELTIAKRYQNSNFVLTAPYYDISAISDAMKKALEICRDEASLIEIAHDYRNNKHWDIKFNKIMECL